MLQKISLPKNIKKFASIFGIYFSKQPAKYDLLKEEIRINLLSQSTAVLHVGAHFGQEAELYSKLKLKVIWIEAAKEPFEVLKKNIKKYDNKIALNALLGDKNRKNTKFYKASNNASSSLFEFGKDMPITGLKMIGSENLEMYRLDTLISLEKIKTYDYWCLDVQGSELLVLKGSEKFLKFAKIIEIEVSTREEYEGGANYTDINSFLGKRGFFPIWKPTENSHENIIYIKIK